LSEQSNQQFANLTLSDLSASQLVATDANKKLVSTNSIDGGNSNCYEINTATRIQNKRDTAANWTANNPTLLASEIGFETDTSMFKIGDGTTAWNSLNYFRTINQADTISDASTQDLTGTGTVDQAKLESDLTSVKNAINTIIDRLQELGLIA